MAIEFKLPDIGEGLADGEIIEWLVSENDLVEEDQPLVEVLTDKATVEIPSPRDGRILQLCAGEGDVVAIGATILLFAESDSETVEDVAAAAAIEAEAAVVDEQPSEVAEPGPPIDEVSLPHDEQVYEIDLASLSADESPGLDKETGPAESVEEPRGDGAEDIELARELARAERTAVEAELGAPGPSSPLPEPADDRLLATPATRRLANELGVDIALVPGSGLDGRVMKEDVRAFAAGGPPETPPAEAETEVAEDVVEEVIEDVVEEVVEVGPAEPDLPAAEEPSPVEDIPPAEEMPPAAELPVAEEIVEVQPVVDDLMPEPEDELPAAHEPTPVPPAAPPAATAGGVEERVPLRGLRRTIAERMVVAKHTAPHYTYVEEADMEQVVHLRSEAKGMAEEHGVKLTYLPFIVRALTMALKKHPYLNASLDEEAGEIVLKRYYNIGIATATDGGLIVPVIKNADSFGLFELASEIQRLSGAARDGSIALDDLQGGTFTITSTGNIGGLLATPILNLPEVAILGVTAIRKRPVVHDEQIAIRHMVNLSLTLDHRVVDGAVGALFMRDLVKLLEDPKLQLLTSL
jgi:pyruvate dehydrogenase E2 component (dihydrolipoamide acetyltransferase)